MKLVNRLVAVLVVAAILSIVLSIFLWRLALGGTVILTEPVSWLAYAEMVGFATVGGYAIFIVWRLFHSTGHKGGKCILCGHPLRRRTDKLGNDESP